jgi:hypothetical protein
LDLFYRIKDCWKRRDTPADLLMRPLEQGLSVKIGEWCFETMFDIDGKSESMQKPYYKQLGKEEFLWFLEDVVEAARLSGFFTTEALLDVIATRVTEIDALLVSDEGAYYDQAERAGRRELIKMFLRLCRDQRTPLLQMGKVYAYETRGGKLRRQKQLAAGAARPPSAIKFLRWQPARRSKKLPLRARRLAPTMSAPPFPGTSGLAALKSVTASSMPLHRRERSNGSQSEKFDAVSLQQRVERTSPLRRQHTVVGEPGRNRKPRRGTPGFWSGRSTRSEISSHFPCASCSVFRGQRPPIARHYWFLCRDFRSTAAPTPPYSHFSAA